MNILEMEDMVKGLPDQVLTQYAQFPDPQIPQFLALSEMQRRQDMRQRFQAQQQGMEPTVKDQILQGGIASAMPPDGIAPPMGQGMAPPMDQAMAPPMNQGMAPPMPPQGMGPQMGPPPVMAYRGGMMPYSMAGGGMVPGGMVRMQQGRSVPNLMAELRAARAAGDAARANQIEAMLREQRMQDPLYRFLDRVWGPEEAAPAAAPVAEPAAPSVAQAAPAPRPRLGREAVGSTVLFPPAAAAMQAADLEDEDMAEDIPALDQGIGSVSVNTETVPPPQDLFSQRRDRMLSNLPGIQETVSGMMPEVPGVDMNVIRQFAPQREDFFNPEIQRRREELLAQQRDLGQTRRQEDLALAQRYLAEAEEPINQLREEARRSAMASALMRLGAGIASGDMASGLSSASESVESIMSRARQEAAAEKRLARQESRGLEREAVRAERAAADNAFAIQAQQITSDEQAQRAFINYQKQFAQWTYGIMRDQGKDQRQARTDAVNLSLSIAQTIDKTLSEELRGERISQDQYTETFGSVFKQVLAEIKDLESEVDEKGKEIPITPQRLIEEATRQTKSALTSAGIVNPAENKVVTVTSQQELAALKSGQRYRGPDGVVRIKP